MLHSFCIFSLFKPGNTCNPETQFWVEHEDGSTSCEDCPSCPPGQTLSIECGKQILSSAMIKCELCKPGMSFSSKHGTSVCTPCSSCAKDQVVLQNCTLMWDIKCDKRCYGKDRYYLLINQAQGSTRRISTKVFLALNEWSIHVVCTKKGCGWYSPIAVSSLCQS